MVGYCAPNNSTSKNHKIMAKKIEEMRNGNEVAVSAKESVKFVELCRENGINPRCTGSREILGNIIVYFMA